MRPGALPARVSLVEGVAPCIECLPVAGGVAMIEGPEGRTLLLARTGNVRKWAAQNLGAGPPSRPGLRPRTNLAPVASAVSYVLAATPFERTLEFERRMAPLVPYAKRKDLKPPAFLEIDAGQRYPRVSVVAAPARSTFGPFRDRRAAERASAAIHKEFPLRPCDHSFEPHAELSLGRACLYAQVRSCAAPCLLRVSETAYRDLAARAMVALGSPARRAGALAAVVPVTVGATDGRGLVVSKVPGGGVIHPVVQGKVRDAVPVVDETVEATVASLEWDASEDSPADWPWLSTWLHTPLGRESFLVVTDSLDLAGAVRALLTPP